MTSPRIALIHALAHSMAPINEAMARDWPEATRMNVLDDSLSADLAAGAGLDAAMLQRFQRLAQYAVDCGSDAILFTCSAFGPCIERVAELQAPLPVLKPNEAMVADAVATGLRVGLIATFAPTLDSMPLEFPSGTQLECILASGALAALNEGDAQQHDALIAQVALEAKRRDCGVVALAQFSMARAQARVAAETGLPVLTTVDSAVRALKHRLARA
jgi:Asp/Glu/hydantoin racemase